MLALDVVDYIFKDIIKNYRDTVNNIICNNKDGNKVILSKKYFY